MQKFSETCLRLASIGFPRRGKEKKAREKQRQQEEEVFVSL
jgi:hypothetical protein